MRAYKSLPSARISGAIIRAVIYARRSQKHQDASVETQIEEAIRFIEKMGWTLVGIYRDDENNTGRKEFKKRKDFLRLQADANEDKFDVVVARDHTRLGGDTSRTMRAIEDLKDEGVAVWYYITGTEVRLDTWIDKATFAFQSAASEGERDGISSRTYEALMVRARAGGNAGGRCFGYDNIPIMDGSVKKRTDYAINEEQARVVRDFFTMRAEGAGLRTIAKALNERGAAPPRAGKRGSGSWSPTVIRTMLRNERYRGVLIYGQMRKTYMKGTKVRVRREPGEVVRVEAPHLRIVSEELWDAVQATFRTNPKKPWTGRAGRKAQHLLSSIGRCSMCGGPMHARNGRMSATPTQVYMCAYFHDRAACQNSLRRPVEEVDAACIQWVQEHVLREEVVLGILAEVRVRVAEHSKDSGSELPQLEERGAQLRREIGNLAEGVAMTQGTVGALVEKLSERQEQLGAVEARLHLIKAAPDVLTLEVRRLEEEVRKRVRTYREFLAKDPEEARKIIEALLDGPLKFTPVETAEGKRYMVEGRVATGEVLRVLSATVASPAGPPRYGHGEVIRLYEGQDTRFLGLRYVA